MKNFKNINKLFFLPLLFMLSGCEKMIQVQPTEAIDAADALNSKSNIEASVFGVYAKLRDASLYGKELIMLPDLLADNVKHSMVSTSYLSHFNNQIGSHFNNWQAAFDGINRANLALSAIYAYHESDSWKDNLAGQVHFIRALLYFDLARAYAYDPKMIIVANDKGCVPLQLKGFTFVNQIEVLPRASVVDVYEQIYKDLDSAALKLERIGGGGKSQHRVTLGAVNALYSRVALFNEDWPKVISAANAAIAYKVGALTNSNNFLGGWRAETHPESIFELKIGVKENLGSNNSLRATYTTRAFIDSKENSTHGIVTVGDDLYNSYATNDVRRQLIMKGLGVNADKNEITKFISRGGVRDLDNIPILRVAEMYLNKAEAFYKTNLVDSANANLNKIIVNRGLSTVNLSGNALMTEILQQRRLEFAFEGFRWFDLKRLGLNIVKQNETISSSNFRMLARLPLTEVNASAQVVKQNRSY